MIQGHVPARVWGFESPLRHQNEWGCGASSRVTEPEKARMALTDPDAEFFEHRCPECGSRAVLRALNMRFLERLLWSRLGLKAYICRDCACRFQDRPSSNYA